MRTVGRNGPRRFEFDRLSPQVYVRSGLSVTPHLSQGRIGIRLAVLNAFKGGVKSS
jgi:hypothetical protein